MKVLDSLFAVLAGVWRREASLRRRRYHGPVLGRRLLIPRASKGAPRLLPALMLPLLFGVGIANAPTNQGFENDYAGWETGGGVAVGLGDDYAFTTLEGTDVVWTVQPYTGSGKMAVLEPNGSTPKFAEVSSALVLSADSRAYIESVFPQPTNFSYVYQDLVLTAGEEFQMAWNYLATDYAPYNDASFVSFANTTDGSTFPFINGQSAEVVVLAATVTGGNYNTGSYGSSGWQTTTFRAVTSGTHRLGFAVYNLDDTARSPYLFIDEAPGITLKDGEVFDPIDPAHDPPAPQVEPDAGVTTDGIDDLTSGSARVAGTITDIGSGTITAHGHVWSTSSNPTLVHDSTDLGAIAAPSSFNSQLSGLAAGTTYYVRAYASNDLGAAYGSEISFTTPVPPPVPPTPITVFNPDFDTNRSMYQRNGTAAFNGSSLKLTDPIANQAGSAFWKDRVILADQRSFSTHFPFLIDEPSSSRADGLAFVIQTVSNAAGSSGGGLGYEGISPSFVVEFDTYTNTNDPNDNHVGIGIDGDTESVKTWIPPFDLVGATRYAWIDYDGASDVVEVRLATTDARPADAQLSYTVDLADVLTQEEVYVGFSGATGGQWSRHQILGTYFTNEYDPIDTSSNSYEQAISTIDLFVSPDRILDNGTDASTVTARALYPDGSVAADRDLDFSVPAGGGTLSSVTAITDASGYASVDVTSASAGSRTVRASVPTGAYGDATVTVSSPPPAPSLSTSAGTQPYVYPSDPVIVDPDLTVTGGNVEGGSVSIDAGFDDGDVLDVTSMHGVTGSYDAATGILKLSGAASAEQYQEILRSVTFGTTSRTDAQREIIFDLAANSLYLKQTEHFYEFVSAPAINWTDAKARAEDYFNYGSTGYPQGVYGLQGYLVTVTSQAENEFVAAKLQGEGWMGASDDGEDKIWRWRTGPEAGTHFFTQNGAGGACGSGGSVVDDAYVNWVSGEPNDYSGGCADMENYAHFRAGGLWNDYAHDDTNIQGYVVEYGRPIEATVIEHLAASKTLEVLFAPTITALSRTSAGEGDTVVIEGHNFTGTTAVHFGGIDAYAFTVDSDTQITATVAYGGSGDVSVATGHGSGSHGGFSYVPAITYTFDYLQEGALHGQDNWISTSTGGDDTFQVERPTISGHDGSPAARFAYDGGGVGAEATRVDDANFGLLDFVAQDSVYIVEFEMQRPYWGGEFWLGYDQNGDGVLSGAGELGLGLQIDGDSGAGSYLELPHLTTYASVPPSSGFNRYQVVIDRSANEGAGSASVRFQDLASVSPGWQEMVGLQEVNLGFTAADDASNPATWNAFRLHSEGRTMLFDDLTSRRVRPSARSFTFANTNVGSASAAQTLTLEGDHLRGNLTATVSGDFRIDGATDPVSGLTDASTLDVTFHPSAGGSRTGTITIVGDDMAAPLVLTLDGQGVPPTITGFTPNEANTGTPIVLTGVNLGGATSVTFGGTEAYDFTVDSDTQITAILAGGTSGSVVATTPNGVATYEGFIAQPPGDIYIEATPGAGRYALPIDHPILADGRLDPAEYAGDLSLDPSASGTFSGLEDADVDVHGAEAIRVLDPLDAGTLGGVRDITLRAGGAITMASGSSIASAGGVIRLATPVLFTNDAGPGALDPGTGRFLVYSLSPEADTTGGLDAREVFGVTYPENPIQDGNVFYYATSLVEGYVFEDANVDLVRGTGESGLPDATVTAGDRTTLTDANGHYRFIGLPAATYTVQVGRPDGYIAVTTDERIVQLDELGVASEQNLGFFAGSRVDGTVFYDDGYAGGTPNDAMQNGSEPGRTGVSLTATHDAGMSRTVTDAAGRYTLFLPPSAGTVHLSHDEEWATGSSFDGTTVTLSGAAPGDLVTFTPTAGDRYRYDFGVVRPSRLSPAQTGQVSAPGSRSYEFLYRPGTQGALSLTVAPTRLEYRLSIQGACFGESGFVHVPSGEAITVGSTWPRSGAALDACTVRAQVIVDSDTSPGTVDAAMLEAALVWSGHGTVATDRATITTEVTGEGTLQLAKQGRNVTQGGSWNDRLEGRPGDVIEYRVEYRNSGTAPVFEVDLRTEVSAVTDMLGAPGDAVLTCPDGSSVELALMGSSIGVDLAAHCALDTAEHPDGSGPAPALYGGEGGALTYQVRID